jgi:PKD repeat protein
MKKNMLKNKINAVDFTAAIVISIILIVSFMVPAIGAEPLPPKALYGTAIKCDGGSAAGGSVVVSASGYPDETDTVDSGGAWIVDIGSDTGTEWPDGTSFTVTITLGSWSGSKSGTVNGFTDAGLVTLDPPTLVASASASETTILEGDTVDFTGSATGGATPYTWDWDFDDGGSSTDQNPSHTFTTQGTYDVVLTVTDDCSNTDTDTVTITVNPPISVDANGPYTGDTCDPVQFTGTVTGGIPPYTYDWDFGDSGTSSDQNPAHQYNSDGGYTATFTVTDSTLDSDSDTAGVTISTAPLAAEAGGPYDGYIGVPLSFIGSATGGCTPYTYDWDFGDGNTGTGQNPSNTYTAAGDYTVTLTITDDNAQTDVDTADVHIEANPPVADAGGPYYGEVGEDIDFYGFASEGTPPYTYDWDFGDGNSGSGQTPTHAYSVEGNYLVTLTVTDDLGKTDDDTAYAYIGGGGDDPIADAGGPYNAAPGETITFNGFAVGGTPPYTYDWDFGDGASGTGQNPTHAYSAEGTYTVTLVVTDDNGKTDDDTTTATIGITPPDLVCSGSLTWTDVTPGSTVTGSFTVSNVGGAGTGLNWEIDTYPSWGTWTFTPDSGTGLTPEAGSVTIQVSVVAPDEEETDFSGSVKIVNSDDSSDSCTISVSLATPYNYPIINPLMQLLQILIQRFPILQQILWFI